MFYQIYAVLRTSYRNSWFRFLFQTTALGQFIAQEEAPKACNFFNIYRSSWWLNRLWIRFFLKDSEDLKQFDNILRCLEVLEKAKIFSEDHCNQVADHQHPHQLIMILSFLSNRHCLDKEFFDLVVKNTLAHLLITSSTEQFVSIKRLMKAGIFDLETYTQVLFFSNTTDLENELLRLEQANSLTKKNFLTFIHSSCSAQVAPYSSLHSLSSP